MPHTHPWSVTEPPGSALAADIDQKIRDLRLDLEERLEETVIEDMSADPCVAKTGLGGSGGETRLMIYNFTGSTGSAGDLASDILAAKTLVVKSEAVIPGGAWGWGVIKIQLSELGVDMADIFAFKAQVWFETEDDSGIGFTLYVSSVWKDTVNDQLAAMVRSGGGSSYSGPAAVSLMWTIWIAPSA